MCLKRLKDHFGYVITLYADSAKERSPIFPFTPHLLQWDIKDPETVSCSIKVIAKEAFRQVRDQIRARKIQRTSLGDAAIVSATSKTTEFWHMVSLKHALEAHRAIIKGCLASGERSHAREKSFPWGDWQRAQKL